MIRRFVDTSGATGKYDAMNPIKRWETTFSHSVMDDDFCGKVSNDFRDEISSGEIYFVFDDEKHR